MIALGLLLLVAAGTVGAAVVLTNTDATSVSALGVTVDSLSLGGVFLVGIALGALALLGALMMLAGARTRRARHVSTRRQVKQLAKENAALRTRVDNGTDHPGDHTVDLTDGSELRTRA